MRRSFLYIFLYLISAIRVCGQLLPIRDYTTREGLNANTVTAILRDSRGLLWVGTYNGVNWYDGARFLQPPMATRSGQVFVTRMMEDSSKQVWIATWYSGLYKFAGGIFTNYLPDPENINAQSNSIVDLAELGGGRYLAATDNNAWIFDGSRFSLLDPGNPLLRQQIHSVLCTRRGDILIGLPQGLGWYKKKGEGWEYAGLVMRGIDINRLAAVRDEAWVTSSKGLYYFPALSAALEGGGMGVAARGGGFRGAVIEAGAAADVFPVGNGSCWYTEVGEGAWSLRGGHAVLHLTRENGLPSSLVRTVYEDAEGITWLGTEYGLAKLAPASYRYYPVPEDSSEGANIIAVGKDAAGTLWMGSFKGLYRMQDGQAREVVLGGGKPYGFVYTMYRDDRNRLWVCTTTGIWLIDKGEPKWQCMAFASSMSESGGVFWFGCMDGRILRLDSGGFREMVQSDPHEERITGIRQDAAGFLWVGYSLLGLRKFSVRNDSLVRVAEYSRENGYGGLLVRNITMDDSGRLLVGTRTHGLYVLGGEMSPPVTRDLGLSGNWVKGIAANAQAVYLATNNGLDVLEGGHYTAPVRHIHFDDEGLSGEFNTLFLEGDTLWLGTAKGVLEYVLERRMPNSLPPPVYCMKAVINGRTDSSFGLFSRESRLPPLDYSQNNLSFDFAGLSFRNEDNVRYRYRLEGLDKDWSPPTDRRYVNYSNLSPGDYHFQVIAANEDGVWSTHPASIGFRIATPFWQKGWFLAFCVALGLGLAYGLYRYRLYQALKIERLRARISTDLHDDIGSTLSSISILSDMALQEGEQLMIREIRDNSLLLLEKMDDIVWSINPRNDTLESLMLRIKRFGAQLFEARGIEYEIDIEPGIRHLRLLMEHRQNLYLIMKEAINNLVKYSGATRAHIRVRNIRNYLEVRISDDGSGFGEAAMQTGNGILNMKNRAAAMKGRLEISTGPEAGTTVILTLKIS